MKPLYRRCAGLDVHKKSIAACIRKRVRGHPIEIVEAVFGTFTEDLERLRQWLREHRVQQVAMESTGVYWIPVWNVLESARGLELVLVNPQTVRALRGKKTDRIDAARLAEYLQLGLLKSSFVPPREVRELRDLTRMRVQVQQDRNRVINRIGRLLETGNIKLGSVASNIVGKTGRNILHAIISGSRPGRLDELAVGSLRGKRAELKLALEGRYSDHLRWMLGELVGELERLDKKLAQLDAELLRRMSPHAEAVRRLCTIPGVNVITAWTLLAELGFDMAAFASAAHAASWAGLCPGNNESARKQHSGRTRKGNRYLRRMLTQSAWAVAHKQDCFLTALFYRVAAHKGMKKAAVAVAHRILVIAYSILRDGVEYREKGGSYFDQQHPERTASRLAQRLAQIGYEVVPAQLKAAAAVAPQPNQPAAQSKHPRPPKSSRKKPTNSEDHVTSTDHSRTISFAVCRRCAKWGIPCIHARNHIVHADSSPPSLESAT